MTGCTKWSKLLTINNLSLNASSRKFVSQRRLTGDKLGAPHGWLRFFNQLLALSSLPDSLECRHWLT